MNSVREPAVAGTFYPNDPASLSALLDSCLAPAPAEDDHCPKAIIAPHAGYIYSGRTAGKVYRKLQAARDRIHRVVLLGPSHRVAFQGMALPTVDGFRTPLGDIPLDTDTMAELAGLPQVGYLDQAHAAEHSLEVHLPFLQRVLNDFSLIPIVVGDASREAVSAVLDRVWNDDGTLVVISSDLSHFHPYDEARQIDGATCDKIERLDASLVGEEACGCRPVNGLLHYLKQHDLTINRVDVCNSGDTAGDRSRVVGYGAWEVAWEDPAGRADRTAAPPLKGERAEKGDEPVTATSPSSEWNLAERQAMLQLARDVIRSPLNGEKNFNLNLNLFNDHLKEERAAFVTINLNGNLRGCIGSLNAHRALVLDIAHNAQSAAFRDPRFKPLTIEEFRDIDVHISILTAPQPLVVNSREELLEKLRPGIDGLIIREGGKQATYLPSVWAQLTTPQQFVTELRRKAGLPAEGWQPGTDVLIYQTEEFA